GGALGIIEATTSIHPGSPKTIAVHGDRGTAVIEQEDVLRWDFTPETDEDRAIKQHFAQKSGATGGASNPAAVQHIDHARQRSHPIPLFTCWCASWSACCKPSRTARPAPWPPDWPGCSTVWIVGTVSSPTTICDKRSPVAGPMPNVIAWCATCTATSVICSWT